MAKIKRNKPGNSNLSGIIRQVGTENYMVKDTPCLIPKENMKMFTSLQKQSQHSSFGDFPNPYDALWKKAGK